MYKTILIPRFHTDLSFLGYTTPVCLNGNYVTEFLINIEIDGNKQITMSNMKDNSYLKSSVYENLNEKMSGIHRNVFEPSCVFETFSIGNFTDEYFNVFLVNVEPSPIFWSAELGKDFFNKFNLSVGVEGKFIYLYMEPKEEV